MGKWTVQLFPWKIFSMKYNIRMRDIGKAMCRNKKLIVYIPYRKGSRAANSNEYISNMIEILEEKYCVIGELSGPLDVFSMLRTKAVFLNWVEDTGLSRWMKIKLKLHKVFGAKIIWVFHNKYPHDTEPNKESANNMYWLAHKSDNIVIHSKNSRKYVPNFAQNEKKAVYVPHILYDTHKNIMNTERLKAKYGIDDKDFVFTMFGRIRPYKNIESGIAAFQRIQAKNAKLLIAGAPVDIKYSGKIKALSQGDDNIILDLHYLPDSKLDAIIDLSDVILLTHKSKSSMNSGVMIQAFSRGKTVISPDICMARDLVKYNFFYMYDNSLDMVVLKAYLNGKDINEQMGNMAKKFVYKHNNKEVVKKYIYKLLK